MLKVLQLSAQGLITSEFEVSQLHDLNTCLDRVAKGDTRGKLVVRISD